MSKTYQITPPPNRAEYVTHKSMVFLDMVDQGMSRDYYCRDCGFTAEEWPECRVGVEEWKEAVNRWAQAHEPVISDPCGGCPSCKGDDRYPYCQVVFDSEDEQTDFWLQVDEQYPGWSEKADR